jgi:hypothetical protein
VLERRGAQGGERGARRAQARTAPRAAFPAAAPHCSGRDVPRLLTSTIALQNPSPLLLPPPPLATPGLHLCGQIGTAPACSGLPPARSTPQPAPAAAPTTACAMAQPAATRAEVELSRKVPAQRCPPAAAARICRVQPLAPAPLDPTTPSAPRPETQMQPAHAGDETAKHAARMPAAGQKPEDSSAGLHRGV